MASMGSAAFKRLVRAGHLVRFVQEDNPDRLLEQLIFGFGFFQRLVRIKTCKPEDDGNNQRSENLGKAFCLFPGIAICHDTPLSVGSATCDCILTDVLMRLSVTAVTLWLYFLLYFCAISPNPSPSAVGFAPPLEFRRPRPGAPIGPLDSPQRRAAAPPSWL